MKEYIIWGVPKGDTEEKLLVSEHGGIKSMEQAKQVCERLEKQHGCIKCHIQVMDLANTIPEDITHAFKRAVK